MAIAVSPANTSTMAATVPAATPLAAPTVTFPMAAPDAVNVAKIVVAMPIRTAVTVTAAAIFGSLSSLVGELLRNLGPLLRWWGVGAEQHECTDNAVTRAGDFRVARFRASRKSAV